MSMNNSGYRISAVTLKEDDLFELIVLFCVSPEGMSVLAHHYAEKPAMW